MDCDLPLTFVPFQGSDNKFRRIASTSPTVLNLEECVSLKLSVKAHSDNCVAPQESDRSSGFDDFDLWLESQGRAESTGDEA